MLATRRCCRASFIAALRRFCDFNPDTETILLFGYRRTSFRLMTEVFISLVQNRIAAVGQGRISLTDDNSAYRRMLPALPESVQQIALTPSHNDQIETKIFGQALAYGHGLSPLDPAQIAVDQNAWPVLSD